MKNIQLNASLGHLFHIINLKMRKKLEKKVRAYDLTSSHQFGVLLLLSKNDLLTQKQIADYTLGDEPTTTRMISRLIKKGLVQKQKNPQDNREQLVSLTKEGKELLAKVTPHAMEINQSINELITQEEHETLLRILNKINEGMK